MPTEKTSTSVSRSHGLVAAEVAVPAPEVDDDGPVDDDADRAAELVVALEVLAERVAHAGEPRVDVAPIDRALLARRRRR